MLDIVTYPNTPVVKMNYSSQLSGREILKALADAGYNVSPKSKLIVDRSSALNRIALMDPISRHYGARPGDVFRVESAGEVKYRQVVKIPMPDLKSQKLASEATWEIYYKAHKTILKMLLDRGADPDAVKVLELAPGSVENYVNTEQYPSMAIDDIKDRMGRYTYVRYMSKDRNMLSNQQLISQVKALVADIHKAFDSKHEHENLDSSSLVSIIVFNNTKGVMMPTMDDDYNTQVFSLQSLSFNVTDYHDQPKFTMLHLETNREELQEIYAANGPVIGERDTLDSLSIKDGTRIILL